MMELDSTSTQLSRGVLTFDSVDEILWCYHSNETSSAVLWRGTICFSSFHKMKSGILSNLAILGSEKVKKLLENVP